MDASYGRLIGDTISAVIFWLCVVAVVCVPLAIWKAVEILFWIVAHLSVQIN